MKISFRPLLRFVLFFIFGIGLACGAEVSAGPLYVAVASNFKEIQDELAKRFTATTKVTVENSSGSTGKLYTQIKNGAPFHIFLAADTAHPERLEKESAAVIDTRFTYAIGQLALYSASKISVAQGLDALKDPRVTHVAIANPETAPYGAAALTVLKATNHWDALTGRIVYGENIAQTHQFIASGATELGFVARSQVLDAPVDRVWLVPQALYDPIEQDGILLNNGGKHPAARAYLDFIRSDEARKLIVASGYSVQP